jgi:membrane-bound metal-dependent hydrolase YbcI (DUF457 family)
MFVGHFALAFGAKKFAPRVSLGVLFLACQLADLLWPNLVLMGLERFEIDPGNTAMTPLSFVHYPYSHSLIALLVWGALFGALYSVLNRTGIKTALIIAGLVLSHWVLDVVTHRPDMPIALGDSMRIGFGLWNYPVLAVITEMLIFAAGIWLYAAHTEARDRVGSIGLWALVVFLLIVYAVNILSPPPPSVDAVAWAAQAMWLVVAWGYWVDRHRSQLS